MTRQSDHKARQRAAGWRFLTVALSPDDQASLARLRARGAPSDQEAIRASLVECAGRVDQRKGR